MLRVALRFSGLLVLLAGCRSELARIAAVAPYQHSISKLRIANPSVPVQLGQQAPARLADFNPSASLELQASRQAQRKTASKSRRRFNHMLASSTMAHLPARPAPAASATPPPPKASKSDGMLNGVLLLVPILALLALVGISLGVAAVFSIGFWPALGWTTLVVVGALLLALAVAILRGK